MLYEVITDRHKNTAVNGVKSEMIDFEQIQSLSGNLSGGLYRSGAGGRRGQALAPAGYASGRPGMMQVSLLEQARRVGDKLYSYNFV